MIWKLENLYCLKQKKRKIRLKMTNRKQVIRNRKEIEKQPVMSQNSFKLELIN